MRPWTALINGGHRGVVVVFPDGPHRLVPVSQDVGLRVGSEVLLDPLHLGGQAFLRVERVGAPPAATRDE